MRLYSGGVSELLLLADDYAEHAYHEYEFAETWCYGRLQVRQALHLQEVYSRWSDDGAFTGRAVLRTHFESESWYTIQVVFNYAPCYALSTEQLLVQEWLNTNRVVVSASLTNLDPTKSHLIGLINSVIATSSVFQLKGDLFNGTVSVSSLPPITSQLVYIRNIPKRVVVSWNDQGYPNRRFTPASMNTLNSATTPITSPQLFSTIE